MSRAVDRVRARRPGTRHAPRTDFHTRAARRGVTYRMERAATTLCSKPRRRRSHKGRLGMPSPIGAAIASRVVAMSVSAPRALASSPQRHKCDWAYVLAREEERSCAFLHRPTFPGLMPRQQIDCHLSDRRRFRSQHLHLALLRLGRPLRHMACPAALAALSAD